MRKIFILIAFLVLIMQTACCQNIGTYMNYYKQASSFAKQTKNHKTAKEVKQIRIIETDTIYNYYTMLCNYDKKNPYFSVIDTAYQKIMFIQEDKYFCIDNITRELTKADKNSELYNYRYNTESKILALNYYQNPLHKLKPYSNEMITKKTDTIIRGIPCFIFLSDETRNYYNKEATQIAGTVNTRKNIFINQKSKDIDSIVLNRTYSDGRTLMIKEYIESIDDFNYHNFQTQLDFNNPKYQSYSRHDENKIPYSKSTSDNKEITSEILNYPIISLNNKKTTISEKNGWILLDFWQFGCRTCFEQFKRFAAENDSLGQTILEKEGVKIMSIQPKSDNMEMIAQVGEKYHVTQYLYSAKGLKGQIEVISYPTYYLISPDKKIAHITHYLGDYSEILQIIKQYNNK